MALPIGFSRTHYDAPMTKSIDSLKSYDERSGIFFIITFHV